MGWIIFAGEETPRYETVRKLTDSLGMRSTVTAVLAAIGLLPDCASSS